LVARISVYASPDLHREALAAAFREGIPMSEWFARAAAEKLGQPELGFIPRKPAGRRGKAPPEEGHTNGKRPGKKAV